MTPVATPRTALGMFAVSLSCTIGVILTVYFSDGNRTAEWPSTWKPVQASVLLAVLSGVFNATQGLALSGGIAIVWWYAADRERSDGVGATALGTLHYIWDKGWGWWKSKKHINVHVARVMMANFFTLAANIASNPLLQKSTDIVVGTDSRIEEWGWWVRLQIPDGWTGTVDPTAPARLIAEPDLQQVAREWYANKTIGNFWDGTCNGECSSTIRAAGVAVACTSDTKYVDLTTPENANTVLFRTNFSRFDDASGTPVLRMAVMYTTEVDSSCNATIKIDTCDFRSAMVLYSVAIYGEDLAMQPRDSAPEVVSLSPSAGDRSAPKTPILAGPLSGLMWFGHYYMLAQAVLQHENGSDQYYTEPSGVLAMQYSNQDSGTFSTLGVCVYQWYNATQDLIFAMHDFMFRMAVFAANGTKSQTSLVLISLPNGAIRYQSDYSLLWWAASIMFATAFINLSLLWGFWSLRWPVSLSPIETAMALSRVMSAHISEKQDAGGQRLRDAEELIREIGDRRVMRRGTATDPLMHPALELAPPPPATLTGTEDEPSVDGTAGHRGGGGDEDNTV